NGARAVVEHDHRPGAEPAAELLYRIEIHRRVEMLLDEKVRRRAAGQQTAEAQAVAHAARVLLEQLANRRAHRQLPRARPLHLAARAVKLRARVARAAQTFEPIGSAVHDVRHVAKRLDVVHDRRFAPQPDELRERGLRARDRAAALERADQRRLLAADVAAGARVQMQLEAERAALYVLPEPAALARLADRVLQPLRGEPIFVAQEDVG